VQAGDPHAVLTPEPIRIWNVAERRIVRTLAPTRPPDYNTQFFLGGAFIDHDRLVAISVAAPHGRYRDELIDVRTGSVRGLQTLNCPTRSQGSQIAASPDGRLVAFVHECGRIRVFDTATGQSVGPGVPADNANSLAISGDGRLLASAATSGTITISRITTGKPVTALSQVRDQSYFLAFSPDGRYFAAGGQDHAVRIWDDRTWNQLRVIAQPSFVFDILFTADSQHFYAMDDTAEIQKFDTCPYCETPAGLVGLARTRVTRSLTNAERAEFSVN
jgi:WD40 repeat protein